jgi:hypothetical protein
VIQVGMNEPGLEFVWVGNDAVDPLQQAQQILVSAWASRANKARAATLNHTCRPQQFRALEQKENIFLTAYGLPSRADIHDLELRLGERLDSLAARFDRTFDPHLS